MQEPSFKQYLLAGPLALIASRLVVGPWIDKARHPWLHETVEIVAFFVFFLGSLQGLQLWNKLRKPLEASEGSRKI